MTASNAAVLFLLPKRIDLTHLALTPVLVTNHAAPRSLGVSCASEEEMSASKSRKGI